MGLDPLPGAVAAAPMAVSNTIRFHNCRTLRSPATGHGFLDSTPPSCEVWVSARDGRIVDAQSCFWEKQRIGQERKRQKQIGDDVGVCADQEVDCRGLILAPGFIDLQLNGAFGIDFSSAACTRKDVDAVSNGVLAHGVTAYCPTVITSAPDVYHAVLPLFAPRRGAGIRTSGDTGEDGSASARASVLGAHLEGPFISKVKKGCHPEQFIRGECSVAGLSAIYGDSLHENAAIITLAPELPGAIETIREAVAMKRCAGDATTQADIQISLGHSLATYEDGLAAVKAGARLVTHLFNAMETFHHRNPGLPGLLSFEEEDVYFGIIADGYHTHNAALDIAHRTCPRGVVLVTDAAPSMGLEPGRHRMGEVDLVVHEDGHITKFGTETLAGSAANMTSCVKNFAARAGPIAALEAASLHPARALGIDDRKGRLDVGCDADMVLLDDELNVHAVFVAGELAWLSPNSKVSGPKPNGW